MPTTAVGFPKEFLDVDSDCAILELAIERLHDERTSVIQRMEIANEKLNLACKEQMDVQRTLVDQINALQRELEALTREEEIPEQPAEEEVLEQEEKPKINSKTRKLCDKFYRKIAAKCHPDKTTNKDLHHILLVAMEARELGRLHVLEHLWETVQTILSGGKAESGLKDRLKSYAEKLAERFARKKELEQAKEAISRELASLKTMPAFQVATDYERTEHDPGAREVLEMSYRQRLAIYNSQLRQQQHALKQQIEMARQVKNGQMYFWSTNSGTSSTGGFHF